MLSLPYGGEPKKKKSKRGDSSKSVITPMKETGGEIDPNDPRYIEKVQNLADNKSVLYQRQFDLHKTLDSKTAHDARAKILSGVESFNKTSGDISRINVTLDTMPVGDNGKMDVVPLFSTSHYKGDIVNNYYKKKVIESGKQTGKIKSNPLFAPLMGKGYQVPLKALGGEIGSAVGSLGDLVAPGLGSVLSPLFGTLGNTLESKITQPKMFNRNMTQVNPVTSIYKHGGFLKGREDLAQYEGLSHKAGGIKVNKNGIPSSNPKAEVEGKESVMKFKGKTYIFSDKLKV